MRTSKNLFFRRRLLTRRALASAIAVAFAPWAISSLAQTVDAPGAKAPGPTGTEVPAPPGSAASAAAQSLAPVTITATRRREPAREVPMQVQAISADQLQAAGAKQLSDYLADQPGVFVQSAGAGSNSITIRGVSTGDQTISTVGIYIDDVAFGSSTAYVNGAQTSLDMGLLDLNHIELLRGPQGTLYGAGSMGGLLKYVTNEPNTYSLTGKVTLGGSLTKGGAAGNTESAVVNVPLKEDVAGLRVAVFHDRSGGYIDAIGAASGKNINGGYSDGGRLSVLIEPSKKLVVRLTALAEQIKRDGTDYVDYDPVTGRPSEGQYKRDLVIREPYSTKVHLLSADVEADLGWARLNSITSSQSLSYVRVTDASVLYGQFFPDAGIATVPAYLDSRLLKQTQELRLTSPSDQSIEWLAGLFYTHERGSNDQLDSSTLENGGAGPTVVFAHLPSALHEAAAYGDVTWKATSKLSFTGGIRVARNTQKFEEQLGGALVGDDVNLPGTSAETAKTYLAVASYALTPTSNVYARAASGYRPGGPNAVVYDQTTGQPIAPPIFKSDTLWSYEAGYKADLLDKTATVEAAVYDIEWRNIQQYVAINGLSVITNGGKARIKGAEFGLKYKLTTAWDVGTSASYTSAYLTDDAPGLASTGAPLPDVPRLAAGLNSTYRFVLAGYPSSIGGSARYIGSRDAGFQGSANAPGFKMPAYWLADLQAGIDLRRFQFAMYVRNLFDRQAILSASTGNVPLNSPVQAVIARPRTIGLTVSTSF